MTDKFNRSFILFDCSFEIEAVLKINLNVRSLCTKNDFSPIVQIQVLKIEFRKQLNKNVEASFELCVFQRSTLIKLLAIDLFLFTKTTFVLIRIFFENSTLKI